MNLVKHPSKYAGGKPKTGDLLAPAVNQVTAELDLANAKLARLLKREGYYSLALPRRLPMNTGLLRFPLSFCQIAEAARCKFYRDTIVNCSLCQKNLQRRDPPRRDQRSTAHC